MCGARRFGNFFPPISAILALALLVADGPSHASAPGTGQDTTTTWLLASLSEASAAAWREDPLLAVAAVTLLTEAGDTGALFVAVDAEDSSLRPSWSAAIASTPADLWLLEERADLSHLPAGQAPPATERLRRFSVPATRFPRFERRLKQRLAQARATGTSAFVVLQGRDDAGLMQIAVLDSAADPASAKDGLVRLATHVSEINGQLRAATNDAGENAEDVPTPGLVGCLLRGETLTDPLEPLPTPETIASPAPAPERKLEPSLAPERPLPAAGTVLEPLSPTAPAGDALVPASDAILEVLHGWAAAWSEQRLDDYLATYASTFQPAGQTPAAWRRDRRARVLGAARIEVAIDNIEIERRGDEQARASFDQRYRSDRYADRVRKQLDLVLEAGTWRITRELVIEKLPPS